MDVSRYWDLWWLVAIEMGALLGGVIVTSSAISLLVR